MDTSTVEKLQRQVAGLEDYSRRKNIRVDGILENPHENWQQTQEKVQKMINEKLQLTHIKVEYAHRISSQHEPNKSIPRTIIARLHHDTDKDSTLRSSWRLTYINEDLSEPLSSIYGVESPIYNTLSSGRKQSKQQTTKS